MQIILSSANAKKIKELQEILSGFEVRSYCDFLDELEIIEDGVSFEENALIKAGVIYHILKEKEMGDFLILADDSGLCVDALGGMPSIYSARFASIKASAMELKRGHFIPPTQASSDEDNNLKLLKCLEELEILESRASFVCVIGVCGRIGGKEVSQTFKGECEGKVIKASLNPQAFGYDPLFVPSGYQSTMDQIREKNQISHRFKALEKFKEFAKSLKK